MSQTQKRRLQTLEQDKASYEIAVCWCAREDGQHEPECRCDGWQDAKVVRWPDADTTPAPA